MTAAAARRSTAAREVRAKTLHPRHILKRDLEVDRAILGDGNHRRPRRRGDCEAGARPCPYVGCAYHLYLDETAAGSLKLNFPDLDVVELQHSCALDAAERGGLLLDEVGELLNLTRGRVQQIEAAAKQKVAEQLGVSVDEVDQALRWLGLYSELQKPPPRRRLRVVHG